MLLLTVTLPSARAESFSLDQGSTVGDLKNLAQQTFQLGFLRLVTAEGRRLDDPQESVQNAGLQTGDQVTALVLQPQLTGTRIGFDALGGAFALWFRGGDEVITWGDPHTGGDSSAVKVS